MTQIDVDYDLIVQMRDLVVARLRSGDLPAGLLDDSDEVGQARSLADLVAGDWNADRGARGLSMLDLESLDLMVEAVIAEMFGLGRLQPYIDDESIENIDVNGCDGVWVTYASGKMEKHPPLADSDEDLVRLVQLIAHRKGHAERQFDPAHPELDLRLPDGSRLSAVMSVSSRPTVSIRRHRLSNPTMDDLVGRSMVDAGLAHLLWAAVRSQCNLMVAGPMNAGKTTLLRALANCIPPYERIVTVEQSFELGLHDLPSHPNAIALEAREPNMEGEGAVAMRRLVRRTKRMNANRVIVGEVLGDEIIDMLTAMLQGSSGSMCTIHSDSAAGTFTQIGNYMLQAPERLTMEQSQALAAQALDFIVYVSLIDETSESEDADPGTDLTVFHSRQYKRVVTELIEVTGYDAGTAHSNTLFGPLGPDRYGFTGVALSPRMHERLSRFGYDHSISCQDLS